MKKKDLITQRVKVVLEILKQLFPSVTTSLHYVTPLEFLIAVIMSAQTTDKQVNKVTHHLFQKYRSIDNYLTADLTEFEKDIHQIGLYKNKAKNILLAVQKIHHTYNDTIPDNINDLMSLPGVGRKTANVVLTELFSSCEGIAVDTHVIRLTQMYGLTKHKDPMKIEQDLLAILPAEEWPTFTLRMIEYGRTYCPAKSHNHVLCPLYQALNKQSLL